MLWCNFTIWLTRTYNEWIGGCLSQDTTIRFIVCPAHDGRHGDIAAEYKSVAVMAWSLPTRDFSLCVGRFHPSLLYGDVILCIVDMTRDELVFCHRCVL